MAQAAAAVEAYFQRVKDGTATEAEYSILPQMLDRYIADKSSDKLTSADIERFDAMSQEGRRGEFPESGMVSAEEAANFIGRGGLKFPRESLKRLAKQGRFIKPVRIGNVDMYDAAELRAWYRQFTTTRKGQRQ